MIKRIVKFISASIALLLLVLIAMFSYGRLRGPSPEQQKAMELLEAKPSFKPEENLAAYLWLLRYEVPEDQIASVYASDVAEFNALQNADAVSKFQTQAAELYKEVNYQDDALSEYCRFRNQEKCLDAVERDQSKIKPILESSQAAIKRVQRIADYRVHYSPMKLYMEGPLPAFQTGQSLLRVHNADVFIHGQQAQAISNVCREIYAWRSIGANSDNLIGSMIGHAYVRTNLALLAEMLAKSDTAVSIPDNCRTALRAIEPQENMLCEAMKGEYGFNKNLEFSLGTDVMQFGDHRDIMSVLPSKMVYSQQLYNRKTATYYANACGEDAVKSTKQAQAYVWDSVKSTKNNQCDAVEWVSNLTGCILIDEASPDFSKYPGRRLDQAAQITAIQILIWLREQKSNAANSEILFSQRPDHLKAFADRIHFDAKANMIIVDLLSPASDGEKNWHVALAASEANK